MKGLEVETQNKQSNTKPTYKEYQKFLQTYDNKSDRSTSPPSLSKNSSSSSVPSTVSETDNVPIAYNEYLQNYRTKKFNTVKPNLPKKNIKTELLVQVNQVDGKDELPGRKFNTLQNRKTPSKIIVARQNSLNKCDTCKTTLAPAAHQVNLTPPLPKQDVVPDEMIYAKTAVLNELNSKPPKLNKSPPPTIKTSVEIVTSNVSSPPGVAQTTSSISSIPPPPPKLPNFTNNTPQISLTVKKVTPTTMPPRKPAESVNKPNFITEMQSKFNENSSQNRLPSKLSSSSQNQNNAVTVHGNQNGSVITGKKSPPLLANANTNSSIPPAPKFLAQHSKSSETSIEANTTTYVPVVDTSANIDKSDPNVKKLVYNTYRGLLGAYNNKANNMVTMPKNRVVQDQGVTKQLESIELQGCLDKLNGRVNPTAGENE